MRKFTQKRTGNGQNKKKHNWECGKAMSATKESREKREAWDTNLYLYTHILATNSLKCATKKIQQLKHKVESEKKTTTEAAKMIIKNLK